MLEDGDEVFYILLCHVTSTCGASQRGFQITTNFSCLDFTLPYIAYEIEIWWDLKVYLQNALHISIRV